MQESIKNQLIELEKSFWDCPPDASAYEEFMMEDGRVLMPAPPGSMNREETISVVEGSAPWTSYEFHELKFKKLDTHASSLSYRATGDREDLPVPYEALISSLYEKDDDGQWKLFIHQQTPVDHK